MRDELEDLRAAGQEKDRVIADLRARLEDENQTVLVLTRKLKILLDKRDERPVVRPSAAEERINQRLANLERQSDLVAARVSRIDSNIGGRLQKFDDRIGAVIDNALNDKAEAAKQLTGLATEASRQVEALHDRVGKIDHRIGNLIDTTGVALYDNKHLIKDLSDRLQQVETAANETQRILYSRHEALHDRIGKIEQVVPPGSGNLQTIVENLADRMASDPKNAFETYVDQRIQRISSWFDTKVSTLGNLIARRMEDHTALQDRVVVTERKIDALEGSENALFDDLQEQITNLKSRTYHNTIDLHNLSARITKLEE